MSKLAYLRRRQAEQFNNAELEAAAETGEVLLREHWHNKNFKTEEYANDLYNVALIYHELGHLERAAELYSDSARQIVQIEGDETESFAKRLSGLAMSLSQMDISLPAYFMLKQVADILRQEVGKNSPEYADTLYNLANIATKLGHEKDALRYHINALKIRLKHEENPEDTIVSLHSVAAIHEKKEDYEKAIVYAQSALDLIDIKDAEAYARIGSYLAELYEKSGKLREALPLYEAAIIAIISRVGREHSSFVNVVYRHANLLARMNRIEEALESYEQVTMTFEGMCGKNHLFYANCLRNMAVINKALDNFEKAEAYMVESIKIRHLIKESGEIPDDIVFLINLYLDTDEKEKAIETSVYILIKTDPDSEGYDKLLETISKVFMPPGGTYTQAILASMRVMDEHSNDDIRRIIEEWEGPGTGTNPVSF
ncbi:MAG: tetratricopeptide repeat protein [Defluviitaleaceae bacterium]|nr:tetratricopeptide repeat protein [Defluviitaleaceae bacterium]